MATTPIDNYRQNQEFYDDRSRQLEIVRAEFIDADKRTQRRALLDSYVFAVLSVQTSVELHESAFKSYVSGGRDLDNKEMKKVNYWKNKTEYIRETETRFREIDKVLQLINEGEIDKAHRRIADSFKGVSTVKGAFVLAMLGFKQKMCIDTNVRQIAGIKPENLYDGVIIGKYDAQCRKIRSRFSDLNEEVDPFIVQWVLFDTIRDSRTDHKEFLDHLQQVLG